MFRISFVWVQVIRSNYGKLQSNVKKLSIVVIIIIIIITTKKQSRYRPRVAQTVKVAPAAFTHRK
jgi:hypothetical protein